MKREKEELTKWKGGYIILTKDLMVYQNQIQ